VLFFIDTDLHIFFWLHPLLEPNAWSNSEIAAINVAVVMALFFSHVDGKEWAAGVSCIGETSANAAPILFYGDPNKGQRAVQHTKRDVKVFFWVGSLAFR
jgi:hypothetical protein